MNETEAALLEIRDLKANLNAMELLATALIRVLPMQAKEVLSAEFERACEGARITLMTSTLPDQKALLLEYHLKRWSDIFLLEVGTRSE